MQANKVLFMEYSLLRSSLCFLVKNITKITFFIVSSLFNSNDEFSNFEQKLVLSPGKIQICSLSSASMSIQGFGRKKFSLPNPWSI